ncbi:hypothetical protein JYU34_017972 [Plutella xylostella]|uniref:C2H2-type domain-containing protein n=1 Tax=Plutella xylostella TaxID=51655 RepID=A0ABQ7PZG1_PLUXY|nr:hypothetical protein JYU34_017972 [Plutella xylostella]
MAELMELEGTLPPEPLEASDGPVSGDIMTDIGENSKILEPLSVVDVKYEEGSDEETNETSNNNFNESNEKNDDFIKKDELSDSDTETRRSKRDKDIVSYKLESDKRKKNFKCWKCNAKLTCGRGLANHLRKHEVERGFQCVMCKDKFDNNIDLVRHKSKHDDEDRTYMCKKCKLAFTHYCDYIHHIVTHQQRSLYKCDECFSYYKEKHTFKNHVYIHCEQHTEAKKTAPKTHKCGECGKAYPDSKMLKYHMMGHTGVRPFQCLYCGKGFRTDVQRRTHTRIHTNERPFVCKHCHLGYKQSTDLKKHSCKVVKKEKIFECELCDKKFKLQLSLATHMLIHSDFRPYPCKLCDHAALTAGALKSHVIHKHTTETPFRCETCDIGFKYSKDLSRHYESKRHKLNVLNC